MTKKDPDPTSFATTASFVPHQKRAEFSCLVMINGEYLGRRFLIKDKPVLIGRSPECDIHLTDTCASRRHCRVVPEEEGTVLVDLRSKNGTYVNDTKVTIQSLKDGDRVMVGRSIFKFLTGDNIEHAYHEEIYRLKTTDSLTGAFNKQYFGEELERQIHMYLRYERPLSLLMMDLDDFKQINDEHGHLAGDKVLAQLGMLISSSIRLEDIFCRYGGDEFALLMPQMDLDGAIGVGARLCRLIAAAEFTFEQLELKTSISIGAAEFSTSLGGAEDLVSLADERLYLAKHKGRSRVEPGAK